MECFSVVNPLDYTVDACTLFPQKQGNSCMFEKSSVVCLHIIAFSLARNSEVLAATRLLYYRLVLHCTVLYVFFNGVER